MREVEALDGPAAIGVHEQQGVATPLLGRQHDQCRTARRRAGSGTGGTIRTGRRARRAAGDRRAACPSCRRLAQHQVDAGLARREVAEADQRNRDGPWPAARAGRDGSSRARSGAWRCRRARARWRPPDSSDAAATRTTPRRAAAAVRRTSKRNAVSKSSACASCPSRRSACLRRSARRARAGRTGPPCTSAPCR